MSLIFRDEERSRMDETQIGARFPILVWVMLSKVNPLERIAMGTAIEGPRWCDRDDPVSGPDDFDCSLAWSCASE